MRVAVVTTSYPCGGGDPSGHFVEAEVRDLEHRHEVVVIRPRTGGAFGWPGVAARVRERPLRAIEAAAWVGDAARQVRAARPDRIVAHWSVPSAWPIAFAAPRGVELEVVSHGGDVRLLLAAPRRVRDPVVSAIARRAARWRFVSRALLDALLDGCGAATAAALRSVAVVAPCSLAVADVREEAAERRRAFAGQRLYVCAARLVADKRVDRIIDYVASEASERTGTGSPVLVVVGDGPDRPRLEELARRWQMDVRFVGLRPRSETLAWLGAADEIVHASRTEGLSTVIREAEHLGVPVTMLP